MSLELSNDCGNFGSTSLLLSPFLSPLVPRADFYVFLDLRDFLDFRDFLDLLDLRDADYDDSDEVVANDPDSSKLLLSSSSICRLCTSS